MTAGGLPQDLACGRCYSLLVLVPPVFSHIYGYMALLQSSKLHFSGTLSWVGEIVLQILTQVTDSYIQ